MVCFTFHSNTLVMCWLDFTLLKSTKARKIFTQHSKSFLDDVLARFCYAGESVKKGVDMGIFVVWVLLAVAVGMLAGSRGRSSGGWCLVSLVFSPLLGFIFLMVQPNLAAKAAAGAQPGPETHVKCAKCAEWVLPEAVVCKHCGASLEPQPVDQRLRDQRMNAKQDRENLTVGIGALVFLFLVAALISKCVG